MVDIRVVKLAKVLVDYSVNVKKKDKVIISGSSIAAPLIKEIYRLVLKKGAFPITKIDVPGLSYIYYKNAKPFHFKKFPEMFWKQVQKTQAYIGIGSPLNTREFTNVDPKKITTRNKCNVFIGHL